MTGVKLGLCTVMIGEAIAVLWLVTRPFPSLDPPSVQSVAQEASEMATPLDEIPSLHVAATRPLFRMMADTGGPAGTHAASALSDQATAWASRLSVIGIVSGQRAQAILEDVQTKKTYLVTVGQHVLEGLVVEAIQPDRVVLSLQGERVILAP